MNICFFMLFIKKVFYITISQVWILTYYYFYKVILYRIKYHDSKKFQHQTLKSENQMRMFVVIMLMMMIMIKIKFRLKKVPRNLFNRNEITSHHILAVLFSNQRLVFMISLFYWWTLTRCILQLFKNIIFVSPLLNCLNQQWLPM